MSKVAIVYWSGTGNTEAMADLIAQGVRAAGGTADLVHAADFTAERVEDYDALAFGCPAMGDEELEDMECASWGCLETLRSAASAVCAKVLRCASGPCGFSSRELRTAAR